WPLDRSAPLPGPAQDRAPAPRPQHASMDGFDGAPGHYDLQEHARQLARRLGPADDASGIRPAITPLMTAGLGDHTVEALRQLVEPLGLDPMQGGGGDSLD